MARSLMYSVSMILFLHLLFSMIPTPCLLSYLPAPIVGEPIDSEWNILPGFSSLQILQKILNDLRERNIEPEKFHRPDHLHRLDKKRKRWNQYFEFRKKAWNTQRNSRRDTGRSSVLETKRSCMELFLRHLKENGTLQPLKRFKDTGHPVFKRISALSRGILKKKHDRHHTLPCGCFKHRALVPDHSFCKSAQYIRSSFKFFGLTEEEKGQEKPPGKKESVTKERCIDKCEITRSKPCGILSKTSIWKQFVRTSDHCPRRFSSQGFAKVHCSCTGFQLVSATKPDLTRTTVLGIVLVLLSQAGETVNSKKKKRKLRF